MPAAEAKQNKKQTIEVVAIVVIFLIIGVLLYRNFAGTAETDLENQTTIPAPTDPLTTQGISQNSANTNNDRTPDKQKTPEAAQLKDLSQLSRYLDKLVKFGDWPVTFDSSTLSQDYGRANPFVPLNPPEEQ